MMTTRSADGLFIGLRDIGAVSVAGLVGAVVAGLIFQAGNPDILRSIGAIVGLESFAAGWLTVLVLGVLLGVPFVGFTSGSVDAFVEQVIMITTRSDTLRKLLVPLLNVSALGVTLFALGLLYGVVVVFVVFGLIAPVVETVVSGQALPGPSYLGPVAILGWTTYGGVLGLCYGLIKEH